MFLRVGLAALWAAEPLKAIAVFPELPTVNVATIHSANIQQALAVCQEEKWTGSFCGVNLAIDVGSRVEARFHGALVSRRVRDSNPQVPVTTQQIISLRPCQLGLTLRH